MIILLLGFLLAQWRRARQLVPSDPKTSLPFNPGDAKAYMAMRKLWQRVALVWVSLFVVLGASYCGASARVDAAARVVEECTSRLQDAPLQACLAIGHQEAMESAGSSASHEVWVWVMAIL